MRIIFIFLSFFLSTVSHALVVLQYHHVSNKTPVSTSISPELFSAHMDYIAAEKFQVVDILQLKIWLQEGTTLPDRTVVITFDDGYRSVFTTAFPELKKRKWPFTVFVNTKSHDEKNSQFMSWQELKTLNKYGAVIANHTDSHPHLIRQKSGESFAKWHQRRESEIDFAEKRLAKELGRSHALFAYPYGEYDDNLKDYLKSKGYLAFGQHSGPISKNSDPQQLPRFPFGGRYGDMEDFASKLKSLPFPLSQIKVTTERGAVINNPELPPSSSKPILRIASPLLKYLDGANCYASGQGKINSEIRGGVLVAQASRDLPPGRSRYNCTVHAGGGRFYWYSQLFIRRLPNGEWVRE